MPAKAAPLFPAFAPGPEAADTLPELGLPNPTLGPGTLLGALCPGTRAPNPPAFSKLKLELPNPLPWGNPELPAPFTWLERDGTCPKFPPAPTKPNPWGPGK